MERGDAKAGWVAERRQAAGAEPDSLAVAVATVTASAMLESWSAVCCSWAWYRRAAMRF